MLLKYLGYQFSIWASEDITLPPSVVNQHFHIWIFSHNFEPNGIKLDIYVADGTLYCMCYWCNLDIQHGCQKQIMRSDDHNLQQNCLRVKMLLVY
jgi:hypothetical protein